jgi:hypothetical protein
MAADFDTAMRALRGEQPVWSRIAYGRDPWRGQMA